MIARCAVVLGSGTLLPACLTQNVQYDLPRNYPPAIESPDTALFPLDSVIRNPTDLEIEGDGGITTLTFIPLSVEVRDANLDDRLQYRIFVDYDPLTRPTIADLGDIPPASQMAADRVRRSLTVNLPVALVSSPGCHRVEMRVSRGFEGQRSPAEPGDLATATWFVVTPTPPPPDCMCAPASPTIDLTECVRR